MPASSLQPGVGRRIVFLPLDGDCVQSPSLTQTLSGSCGNGISPTGEVGFQASCTGTEFTFGALSSIVFTDAQLDANGDGRFNERDWPLIQALLNSTDPDDLAKYNLFVEDDLNQNGDPSDDQVIAQEDLDIIRSILDAGLGAGEFGDWNGDGVVDCADYAGAPSTFDAEICDPGYLVELDFDLDGDNDGDDRTAFESLFPTADLADPFGVLDLSDLTAFMAAFNNTEPLADLAPPYSVWDLNDLTAFMDAFQSPCP